MKKLITALALILGFSTIGFSQGSLDPKPSPLDVTKATIGDAYVKIVYSRPHMRGREIFGNLVPYGNVWRTGANAATEITLTKSLTIGGQQLEAGTYSLFTIPNEDEWTIIINRDLGQWGAYRYNADHDVLRFNTPVMITDETWEPFTIAIETESEIPYLEMKWDQTKVSIPITE